MLRLQIFRPNLSLSGQPAQQEVISRVALIERSSKQVIDFVKCYVTAALWHSKTNFSQSYAPLPAL